jgi:hypothetical protein
MQIKLFVLGVLFLFSEFSSASPDYWSKVDEFVGSVPLCEAFVDRSEYVFQRETCSISCDKWKYSIKVFCSNDKNEARLDYYGANGIFARTIIKLSDWQRMNGNMLRAKKESANSSGLTFELTAVTELQDQLLAKYEIRSKSKTVETGQWTMHRQTQALFQLAIREETALIPFQEKRTDQMLNGL